MSMLWIDWFDTISECLQICYVAKVVITWVNFVRFSTFSSYFHTTFSCDFFLVLSFLRAFKFPCKMFKVSWDSSFSIFPRSTTKALNASKIAIPPDVAGVYLKFCPVGRNYVTDDIIMSQRTYLISLKLSDRFQGATAGTDGVVQTADWSSAMEETGYNLHGC